MMVKDRKTGQVYDPELRLQERMAQEWFVTLMKRLAVK